MYEITLICPSFDRHNFLRRSWDYWSNKPFYVIYADGSKEPCTGLKESKNLTYFHDPRDFWQRLDFLVSQVNTKYICLLDDDEYYAPEALKKCQDFLNKNNDYVACMGRAIRFEKEGSVLKFRNEYPGLKDKLLDSELARDRLLKHFNLYAPAHCHSVTRIDVFKDVQAGASYISRKFDIYSIWELINEFLVPASGKSCVLPILFWFRSMEAVPIRDNGEIGLNTIDPQKRFHNWWKNKNLKSEHELFCKLISEFSKDSITEKEIKHIFSEYSYQKLKKRYKPIKLIKENLPKRIKDYLKIYYCKIIKILSSNEDPIEDLRNEEVSIYEKNINEIIESINSINSEKK